MPGKQSCGLFAPGWLRRSAEFRVAHIILRHHMTGLEGLQKAWFRSCANFTFFHRSYYSSLFPPLFPPPTGKQRLTLLLCLRESRKGGGGGARHRRRKECSARGLEEHERDGTINWIPRYKRRETSLFRPPSKEAWLRRLTFFHPQFLVERAVGLMRKGRPCRKMMAHVLYCIYVHRRGGGEKGRKKRRKRRQTRRTLPTVVFALTKPL